MTINLEYESKCSNKKVETCVSRIIAVVKLSFSTLMFSGFIIFMKKGTVPRYDLLRKDSRKKKPSFQRCQEVVFFNPLRRLFGDVHIYYKYIASEFLKQALRDGLVI